MTVMVPDLVLICENMLMAEGFIEAKVFTCSSVPGVPTLLRRSLPIKWAHCFQMLQLS